VITFPHVFDNLIKYVSEEAIVEIFGMAIDQSNPFIVAVLEDEGTPIDTLQRLFEFRLRISLYEYFNFIEKVKLHSIV